MKLRHELPYTYHVASHHAMDSHVASFAACFKRKADSQASQDSEGGAEYGPAPSRVDRSPSFLEFIDPGNWMCAQALVLCCFSPCYHFLEDHVETSARFGQQFDRVLSKASAGSETFGPGTDSSSEDE